MPAFIHGDLVQPGAERRALIKALQREVRLQENLLGYIFDVHLISKNTSSHREPPPLVAAHQLLIRALIVGLRPRYQLPVVVPARAVYCPGLRRCFGLCLCFWDARHSFSVTLISPNLIALSTPLLPQLQITA